jgi:N-acetylneuraminate synthase
MVFHRDIFGPNAIASLTIEETNNLLRTVFEIHEALESPINKNQNENLMN